jgi:hypothetical protein
MTLGGMVAFGAAGLGIGAAIDAQQHGDYITSSAKVYGPALGAMIGGTIGAAIDVAVLDYQPATRDDDAAARVYLAPMVDAHRAGLGLCGTF